MEFITDIEATTLPTGRTYHTPDGDYPSITTILSKTNEEPYLAKWIERVGIEEADRIKNEAAERGTKIHDYLEQYWSNNHDSSKLLQEPNYIQYMTRSLIKYTEDIYDEVIALELPVWSNDLKVAGRFDKLVKLKGKNSLYLLDYKSSRKKKYKLSTDYKLQCSFYVYALNELYNLGIDRYCVLIVDEEKYEVKDFRGFSAPNTGELKYRINKFYSLGE